MVPVASTWLLCGCLLASLAVAGAAEYNTSSSRDPNKLNVHLVAHTHDDSGWLKTFEQYYWGTRQDIQMAAVQHVLSTVVQALQDNPDRKFCYAEMSFFSKWWQQQSSGVQQQVRELVASGRLDFVNGGFVQHDEAAAHYVAMIDQTTRGHRFLNATFGITPSIAWQIDPFGHSATQAALMSAAAGYEALFFGRADYQDMRLRLSRKQLELLWRPSLSWGESGQVWTHNYPSGNYGPPPGFNFDWAQWDAPIVDDPDSPEYNVPNRVNQFVYWANTWSASMAGNDILFMMGSDFQFANSHANFINLDRLIHYVNADGRVNVFYSTPAAYTAAKANYSNVSWPIKTDDFFPYADCAHCYWTGYFTSRPASKGYIRQATAYLAAARQLQAITPHLTAQAPSTNAYEHHSTHPGSSTSRGSNGQAYNGMSVSDGGREHESSSSSAPPGLDLLESAVSLSQHHDAVTGTAKQAVANDYARYLYLGLEEASQVVITALEQLLKRSPPFASQGSSSASNSSNQQTARDHPLSRSLLQRSASMTRCTLLAVWQDYCRLGRKVVARFVSKIWPLSSLFDVQLVGTAISPTSIVLPHGVQQLATATAAHGQQSMGGQNVNTGQGRAASINGGTAAAAANITLWQCPLLNVSICATSLEATRPQAARLLRAMDNTHVAAATNVNVTATQQGLLIVAYNSLGWDRAEYVRVPVADAAGVQYTVQDSTGQAVAGQLVAVSPITRQLQQSLAAAGLAGPAPAAGAAAATQELVFKADIPPVGYATYAVLVHQNISSNSNTAYGSTDGVRLAEKSAVASTVSPSSRQLARHNNRGYASSTRGQVASRENVLTQKAAPSTQQHVIGRVGQKHELHNTQQLSTGVINVTLDLISGRFTAVAAADGGWYMNFMQEFMWYKGSTGWDAGTDSRCSNKPAKGPAEQQQAAPQGSSAADIGGGDGGGAGAAHHSCSDDTGFRPHSGGSSTDSSSNKCLSIEGCSQSSGAYILRPAGDAQAAQALVPPEQPIEVTVIKGPLLTEVRQTWANWASLTTRLWAGAGTLDQEWTVGPIPVADRIGREVIIKASTDMVTGGTFFTDSNGREVLRRVLNKRPTWQLEVHEQVAGNYYPITAAAAITDGCLALGVATDRAQGAASLDHGQLEIMVHRTTIVDDARGVGEPLNETLCGCTACGCVAGGLPARGRHMLVVGPATGAARHLRLAQQLLNDPLLLTFAKLPAVQPSPSSSHAATAVSPTAASNHGVASSSANRNSGSGSMGGNTGDMVNKLGLQGTWSGLSGQAAANGAKVVGLPKNVHLVTLMRAHDSDPTRLIIRLAHTFQMGEDNELSFPVHVNLSQLLAFSISNITELSLTAARYKVGMQQRRNWTAGSIISGDNSRAHNGVQRGRKAAAAGNASQQGSHDEFSGQNSMHGWGDAFMPELAAASSCQAKQQRNSQGNDASAFADTQQRMHRVVVQAQHADEKQRHDPMQAWQQHKLQHTAVSAVAVYDIWAHHGDRLPVVELYPMEIRTWELIIDV